MAYWRGVSMPDGAMRLKISVADCSARCRRWLAEPWNAGSAATFLDSFAFWTFAPFATAFGAGLVFRVLIGDKRISQRWVRWRAKRPSTEDSLDSRISAFGRRKAY